MTMDKKISFIENNVLRIIVNEIAPILADARFSKIYSLDLNGLVFSLSTKTGAKHLVFCLNSQYPAFYLTDQLPAVEEQTSNPFENFLKKARFVSIKQVNHDRIIEIVWNIHHPIFGDSSLTLMAEFFGAFSNIILFDNDRKIIAVLNPQGPSDKTDRTLMTGAIYQLPDLKTTPNFFELKLATFCQAMRQIPEGKKWPVWKALVYNLSHISPFLAKEIIRRSELDPDEDASALSDEQFDRLWDALVHYREIVQNPNPTKWVYFDRDTGQLLGISPFQSSQFGNAAEQTTPNVSALIAEILPNLVVTSEFALIKQRLQRDLKKRIDKATHLRQQLKKDMERAENADQFRLWGELIKANRKNVKRGQSEVTVTNFYDPQNAQITIKLDPELDLHQNADRYFNIARKAEASEAVVKKRIRENNSELVRLHRWNDALGMLQTTAQLEEFAQKINQTELPSSRHSGSSKQTARNFREFTISDGWRVLVGRNNKENDLLTHRTAALDDLWFHAQSIRGSHVVLRREGKKRDISPSALEEAAAIAAHFSKAKHSSKVPVVYVEVRYLRKPRGAAPGLVTYTNEKTLFVKPSLPARKED